MLLLLAGLICVSEQKHKMYLKSTKAAHSKKSHKTIASKMRANKSKKEAGTEAGTEAGAESKVDPAVVPDVLIAGFNSVSIEPPAAKCNDVVSTEGQVIPDLGNVRVATTAFLQFNIWSVLILGTKGDAASVLYQYNFSDVNPDIKFIFNTEKCFVI